MEHLADKERVLIVAKVVLAGRVLLHELSPGSRLKKAPRDLFPKRTKSDSRPHLRPTAH